MFVVLGPTNLQSSNLLWLFAHVFFSVALNSHFAVWFRVVLAVAFMCFCMLSF